MNEDTYKSIIDKVGQEINSILKGMKDDKQMKDQFIQQMYHMDVEESEEGGEDRSGEKEVGKSLSERSKRLPDSSEHSYYSGCKQKREEKESEDLEDFEEIRGDSGIATGFEEENISNSSKEYIGAHSFTAHELLGTGSFGEVYLVEKISDKTLHAMKVL